MRSFSDRSLEDSGVDSSVALIFFRELFIAYFYWLNNKIVSSFNGVLLFILLELFPPFFEILPNEASLWKFTLAKKLGINELDPELILRSS
jgi:hypothetical protein